MRLFALLTLILFGFLKAPAQADFPFELHLEAVTIESMPGLHSFAHASYDGKWLFVGGRTDGIHAHQPFAAFPESNNNTNFYVVDIATEEVWSSSILDLPTSKAEQLQATNMNFVQDDDILYFAGGYAYAASVDDHITFPYLTAINVPELIDAIINVQPLNPAIVQIQDEAFAVTGGYMGKMGDDFLLVGGHRFDGRYNPMGMPTFVQTYHDAYDSFNLTLVDDVLTVSNFQSTSDPIHLRRRDFNLLPQIFPNGTEGFTISSGVFQINADLPFLYPVNIDADGYEAIPEFNQYLSNYHSAHACLYDADQNKMHNLFFGGISQYYYSNGALVQDDNVPFVRTISRMTRYNDGSLQEFQLTPEMPSLAGASAEFFINESLPQTAHGVIQIGEISTDTILIGHVVGGILSSALNPFTTNDFELTSANPTIYEIKLVRNPDVQVAEINGSNPYTFKVYPNPADTHIGLNFTVPKMMEVDFYLSDLNGKLLNQGTLPGVEQGANSYQLPLPEDIPAQMLTLTCVFDGKYFVSKTLVKQ